MIVNYAASRISNVCGEDEKIRSFFEKFFMQIFANDCDENGLTFLAF